MIRIVTGDSANHVWTEATRLLATSKKVRTQASRAGKTRELLHVGLSIKDPRQRWAVSRSPVINVAFALVEVVWFMSGRRDAAFLNYWNSRLPALAGGGSEYPGSYGFRIRRSLGFDQLLKGYQALDANPESRQVVLQMWNAEADLPLEDGAPRSADVPCNIVSMLKVRGGKLEWLQVARSNDLFLGIPYDFALFTHIQEILAGWLGVEVGSYNHICDSLHVYTEERPFPVAESVYCQQNSDDLRLPRPESEKYFGDLARRIDFLTGAELSRREHVELATVGGAPRSIENFFAIIAAEGARRRGWPDLAHSIASRCTNPLLSQLWSRWWSRVVG